MSCQEIISLICSILSLAATIGIGIIAYLQNKKYDEKATRQNLKQEYQNYRDIVQKDFDYICVNFFPYLLNMKFMAVINEAGNTSDKNKVNEYEKIFEIYGSLEKFKTYVLSTKTHSDYIGLGFECFYNMLVSFDKLLCLIDKLYKNTDNQDLIIFWEDKLVKHNNELVNEYGSLFDDYTKYYRKYLSELNITINKIGDYSIKNKTIKKEIKDLKSKYLICLSKYRAYIKEMIQKETDNGQA